MNRHPKPIETHYRGHRFRSRLEARWAVLFDAMGWPYQYETEGYDLGKFGYYLPDFWIPVNPKNNVTNFTNAGYWIEIKGRDLTKEEKLKIAALSKYTKHTIKVFIGTPGDHLVRICHNKRIKEFAKSKDSAPGRDLDTGIIIGLDSLTVQLAYDKTFDIENAISQAKMARFEFGETPK